MGRRRRRIPHEHWDFAHGEPNVSISSGKWLAHDYLSTGARRWWRDLRSRDRFDRGQQLIAGLVEDGYDPLPREASGGDCRLLKRRVAIECGGCTPRWRTCGRLFAS